MPPKKKQALPDDKYDEAMVKTQGQLEDKTKRIIEKSFRAGHNAGLKACKATKKRKRADKDPNKPKRAKTAFLFFTMDERPKVKEANPKATFADIGKKLGKQWNKLSAAGKKKYEEQAKTDKARYEDEMKAYSHDSAAPTPANQAPSSKTKKRKKKTNATKDNSNSTHPNRNTRRKGSSSAGMTDGGPAPSPRRSSRLKSQK